MRQGLIWKQGLDEQEQAEIRELAEACEEHDGIRLKLNWDMLQARPADQMNDVLYYKDGKLVAFLGIYIIIPAEAELSGMVHPDYRRQGMFMRMVEEALEQLSRRGPKEVIYICPRDSASGVAFLQRRGLPYAFSEYVMERKDADNAPLPSGQQREIHLREAGSDDVTMLAELNRVGFGLPEQEADDLATAALSTRELTYIIESGGRAVGKLGVLLEGDTAFIYGFCMRPEERGHGLGRAALAGTIERLRRELNIACFELEVAVSNERALGLYESCGFRRTNVIDYYKEALL